MREDFPVARALEQAQAQVLEQALLLAGSLAQGRAQVQIEWVLRKGSWRVRC